MKRQYWIALIIAAAIGIIITLVLLLRQPKVTYTFPDTLVVNNFTEYKDIDTTALLILDRILKIDSMTIFVYYAPMDFSTENTEIIGYVQKNHFTEHTYNIFCTRSVLITSRDFLAHELAHVEQMEKGDLIETIGTPIMIYKGVTIDPMKVPYSERQYEIDAEYRAFAIRKEFNKL